MNGASGFSPPLYWFFDLSGALESSEDYDYVLPGLQALGVRYVGVYMDADLADVETGRVTLRAIRGQPLRSGRGAPPHRPAHPPAAVPSRGRSDRAPARPCRWP